jgi:hypothetical protein
MAFDSKQFSKVQNLNPASGLSVQRQVFWYEGGADAIAAIVTAGYFNSVRNLLQVGDRIMVVCNTIADFRVLKVSAVPATGNVTATALAFS